MTDTPSSGKRSVTDRVNDRLVAGNYESYSQIAREEGTTEDFVSKRAHELRKQGKLVGDRRSRARQSGIGEDDIGIMAEPLTDKIFEQRMAAYRMMGVPEADIKTMEAGRFDLAGLRKAKEQARLLKYDRRIEELVKAFPNLPALNDFIGFYNDVHNSGVRHSQYTAVMTNVRQSMTLDDKLEEQRSEMEENAEKMDNALNLITHYQENAKTLSSKCKDLENKIAYYEPRVSRLETSKKELDQYFMEIAQGKRYGEEIRSIVSDENDKLFREITKWKMIFGIAYAVACKYPDRFQAMSEAFRSNDTGNMNANASLYGQLFHEADHLLKMELDSRGIQIVGRKLADQYVSDSLW